MAERCCQVREQVLVVEDEVKAAGGLDDVAALEAAEQHWPAIRSVKCQWITCMNDATYHWRRAVQLPQIQSFQCIQAQLQEMVIPARLCMKLRDLVNDIAQVASIVYEAATSWCVC